MANRRTPTMDVHEVVRLLQAGASDREVAQLVGLNRRTVARYRRWAEREGMLAGPLPAVGELETRLATSLPATVAASSRSKSASRRAPNAPYTPARKRRRELNIIGSTMLNPMRSPESATRKPATLAVGVKSQA